jgi:hypothetical protein
MRLTILTPRLPPSVCGVGDHSVQLAKALRPTVLGVTALCVHGEKVNSGLPFDRVDPWDRRARTLAKLLDDHNTDCLWVQYSGYGYNKKGLPWYLVRAVKSIRPRWKISVFFHETHCSPRQLGWKGSFIAPLQRRIGKELAALADTLFTSTELYVDSIHRDYGIPKHRITLLPLGSNIPVPSFTPRERESWRAELQWEADECVAVTFGSAGSQRQALLRNCESLISAIQAGVIQRVLCIGGDPGTSRDDVLNGVRPELASFTKVVGHQSPEQIAKVLVAADVAVIRYPFKRIGKSGAFMACSLAGLPLLVGDDVPADVCQFRAARLVRSHNMQQFKSVARDIESRLARHREATKEFSWAAIARNALRAMKSLKTSTQVSSPAI